MFQLKVISMKSSVLGCILVLSLLLTNHGWGENPPWLEHTCLGKKVVFNEKSFPTNVEWEGVGEPPLSVGGALVIAQKALDRAYAGKQWRLSSVRLRRYGTGWFYFVVMDLRPSVPPGQTNISSTGIPPTGIIVVSMEGKYIKPR
jgi:hypothetical protein